MERIFKSYVDQNSSRVSYVWNGIPRLMSGRWDNGRGCRLRLWQPTLRLQRRCHSENVSSVVEVRHAVAEWLLNNGSIIAKSYVARFEVLTVVL